MMKDSTIKPGTYDRYTMLQLQIYTANLIQNVDDGQVQQQITTVKCPQQPRGQLQTNIDMQIGTRISIAGEPRPALQPQQLQQQRRMVSAHADMHSNQMTTEQGTASSTKWRSTDDTTGTTLMLHRCISGTRSNHDMQRSRTWSNHNQLPSLSNSQFIPKPQSPMYH